MKVLIIGGAGYVGSVLTEELLERGYSVKILERFYFGASGLSGVRDRVEIVRGDMRTMPASVLADVGAVVNLGGLSNDPTAEYNPKANFEMNTMATKLSAELCKAAGIKRYVMASSCSVYDVGVKDEEKAGVLRPLDSSLASVKLPPQRSWKEALVDALRDEGYPL